MGLTRERAQRLLDAHADALRARGLARWALFGSVARNEARPDSDVDLLVDYDPDRRRSLLDVAELERYLSDVMGRPVEVVDRAQLKPFLKDRIIAEAEGRFVTPTPPKSPRQPLADMLENTDDVISVMPGRTIDDYRSDMVFRKVVERSIEIVSEASRRLPKPLKARHPEIRWQQIADIGNVLRHLYHRVETETMWQIITEDVGPLRAAVVDLIAVVDGVDSDPEGRVGDPDGRPTGPAAPSD